MAAFEETGGYCEHCEKRVMVRRKGTSHILHLLLTLCTFGLWLIFWFASSIKIGGWRCPLCGTRALTYVPRSAKKAEKAARAAPQGI